MKTLLNLSSPIILALLFVFSICSEAKEKKDLMVGGRCDYKAYEGWAKIVSITSQKETISSKEEYEVKFLFSPAKEIEESYAQVNGKEFQLLINNTTMPDKAFIEKYNLNVGKMFSCTLQVIVKGTCTPILFEFPFAKEGRKK